MWWRALACTAIGILIGMSLATLRLGEHVDRLTLDNAVLMDEVERLSATLASREQALTEQSRAPVHSVEVEVVNLSEEHVRLHIEQRAHALLRHLVGEEIDALNAALVENALSRTIEVDMADYTMTPTLIVLGRKVYVRLEGRPGKSDAGS